MASSSTSSSKSFKYEVFLSFRGEDTRYNFVAHLHSALKRQSIHTFKDDENMVRGERISGELIKAIEASRLYIIVFSRNYASSSWCLDELVKIMECQKTTEHKAYPIFYDVEPTEVRKQIGAVGEAFTKRRMDEGAGNWIEALKEATDLAGFTLKGDEAKFIDEIVEKISLELPSINFSDIEKFIGMDGRVEDIVSSLKTGSTEVRMIGIKGMGGGGKTTLAKAVFDQISHKFKHKSFVEDVRESVSKDLSGLNSLQKQVLSDVLKDQKIKVTDVSDGKLQMKKRMHDKKVLLVLDDVDDIEQLKALAEPNCFTKGSIIIITTRDEGVLIAHGVKSIHGVNLLSDEEAIRLFRWYAFGTENPIPDQYKELSRQVVRYAAGLPLTIRVLGLDLKGKEEDEWKDTLKSLEKIPPGKTLQRLELSYLGLEPDYKDIFLDVACFWKGRSKYVTIRALESCQLQAKLGLRVLERKSLITVSEYGLLEMHDSIQDMGWDIVRREHPNYPERHSRLWINEEIEKIFANDWGSEATRGIKMSYSTHNINPSIIMKGLKNMKKLRFLKVTAKNYNDGSHRDGKFDEASEYFPNALQYLSWYHYPFSSLPITFEASNLVGLDMSHSNLVQLCQRGERKVLKKLRFFMFSGSCLKTLDLGFAPNLEILSIVCPSFEKLHMPAECLELKSLYISGSKLTTLDLGFTPNLETLSIVCPSFEKLHMPAECLELKSLYISGSKLTTLDLGFAPNLETLSIVCPSFEKLHMPAECLELKSLYISGSKLTTLDLGGVLNLEVLSLLDCFHLAELHMPAKCIKFKSLSFKDCLKLTALNLGGTPNLKRLVLNNCNNLVELQMPTECLKLKSLDIGGPKLTILDLGGASNLETLSLQQCICLVELHMPIECVKLKSHNIQCSKLMTLILGSSTQIIYFPDSICMLQRLKFLTLESCPLLEKLPEDIGQLECLETLSLSDCKSLKDIPDNICKMKRLEYLCLRRCIAVEKLPEELGSLKCLKELDIRGTRISHLPLSIVLFQDLRIIGSELLLQSCNFTSEIQTSNYETSFCYKGVYSRSLLCRYRVFRRRAKEANS